MAKVNLFLISKPYVSRLDSLSIQLVLLESSKRIFSSMSSSYSSTYFWCNLSPYPYFFTASPPLYNHDQKYLGYSHLRTHVLLRPQLHDTGLLFISVITTMVDFAADFGTADVRNVSDSASYTATGTCRIDFYITSEVE